MRRTARALATIAVAVVVAGPSLALVGAQVAMPNRAGVAFGHVHFVVRDLAASKRFWTALGGVPIMAGTTDGFRFPGVIVVLTAGAPTGDGTGEVIDHIAFRTRSLDQTLAAVKAAGFHVEPPGEIPNTGRAYTPDGYKVELFDAPSESPRFFPDSEQRDSDWERSMAPMTVPIVTQHIHYYLRAGVEREAKAWYFRMFGGTEGRRLQYAAVDLPGINLNFSVSSVPSAPPSVPTRGRTLDHLGFEVRDLAGFCKKLETAGVRFDAPYARRPDGIASASLTDPWGASIELTQGLNGL